jgi:hypothetical protein
VTDALDPERRDLAERVDRLIEKMSVRLPWSIRIPGVYVDGWDEARRKQWLDYMKDLRTRLASEGSSLEWDAQHLTRSMDHDGIQSGEWWSEAYEIQASLRRLLRLGDRADHA